MSKDDCKPGRDYAVGYGRPPQHTRFRPGQSGNPGGRPKGARNLLTELDEALAEKVVVVEGGKRRRMSKSKLIAKTLANKAAGSDLRAARHIFDLRMKAGQETVAPVHVPQVDETLSPEDDALLRDILRDEAAYQDRGTSDDE